MGAAKALRCRECGAEYPLGRLYVCSECFSALEVVYDYDLISLKPYELEKRPKSLWRYFELLPVLDKRNAIDLGTGFTPLQEANNLAKALGVRRVYIKNDTLTPTGSFKDRPASVAVSKALELGFRAVGCASTGNLAAATAAHAAKAGLPCYVFAPRYIEFGKVLQAAAYGAKIIAVENTFDDANRLAVQAAEKLDLGIVNVNVRPYYVEGSKTLAYEVAEQLCWRVPDRVIAPIASGALLTSLYKGFLELRILGLTDNIPMITGAQPLGCAPVANAFKHGLNKIIPVKKPDTIAKGLAIGDPSYGVYALRAAEKTGGVIDAVNDAEIIEGIKLLAKTEGIFSEPAGGVVIGVLKKLISEGVVGKDEEVVCYITGNGLKTLDIMPESEVKVLNVKPRLDDLILVLGA
ncbi:MAG: threonine synthase [Candidatus Methanomethylicota archaeon]|uniref:Threonine synthase n=1 Tax=Thermoproteota archaeon TaxID=2056631 RepID=A0A497EU20_9CREN|nr:MAG: threonine synthase [Candidatus Verstraetearchaeota archaeon]RLE50747.1 MAG: threonine synthase [Candidatus Verstraetearchaeota archaeon]